MGKADQVSIHKTGPLQYSGYYDWPGLYAVIANWAKKERLKIFESLYKDKTSKGFTEREVEMTLVKKVDRFNKYYYKVAIKMWDTQQVEVTQNGVTKKVERGRFRVLIEGVIDKDYQEIFAGSSFWKNMGALYFRMMFWDWAFKHADFVQTKIYELQGAIKQHLGMDTK